MKILACILILPFLLTAYDGQPARVYFKHIENKGIGYNTGYSTAGLFLSPTSLYNDSWLPYLDGRWHVFDDGKMAANGALGVRFLTSRIYGLYASYDYRRTRRTHYNQVGVGVELLGKIFDVRFNGYFPVGTRKSSIFDVAFAGFSGNQILVDYKREFAMAGGNAEAGFRYKRRHVELYGALGPYYFNGCGKTAAGGEARAKGTFFECLGLQASTSYDSLFKWIVQGEISLSFQIGPKQKTIPRECRSCDSEIFLRDLAHREPDRDEIIVVGKRKKQAVAINPGTGFDYVIWFVNNLSSSLGTFESPFPTLLEAQLASSPNDIIYVFQGDGTNAGMNTGISLQSGQRFYGSGVSHSIPTTLGQITIPALTSGLPTMSNSGSIAVDLSNLNEVVGFNITDCSVGVRGVNPCYGLISQCNINADSNGINMDDFSAVMTVTNNNITSTVGGGFSNGINLNSTQMGGENVSFNTISNYNANGIALNLSGDAAHLGNITGNNLTGIPGTFCNGIRLFQTDQTESQLAININQCIDNDFATSLFASDTSSYSLSILNNTFEGPLGIAYSKGVFCESTDFSTTSIDVIGNLVSNHGDTDIQLNARQSANLTAFVSNNTVTSDPSFTAAKGIESIADESSTHVVIMQNNVCKAHRGTSYSFRSTMTSSLTATVEHNAAIGLSGYMGVNGLQLNTNGTAKSNMTIRSNYFENQSATGIGLDTNDDGILTAYVLGNTILSDINVPNSNGIGCTSSGTNPFVYAEIKNNLVRDHEGIGIASFPGAGVMQGTIQDNEIYPGIATLSSFGINISPNSTGVQQMSVRGNIIGPTGAFGIVMGQVSSVDQEVEILENVIIGAAQGPGFSGRGGGIGIAMVFPGTGNAKVALKKNILIDNLLDGGIVGIAGPSSFGGAGDLCLTIDGNTSNTGYTFVNVDAASFFTLDDAGNNIGDITYSPDSSHFIFGPCP